MTRMLLTIIGHKSAWAFNFEGDEEHIPAWRDDGIEVTVIEATTANIVIDEDGNETMDIFEVTREYDDDTHRATDKRIKELLEQQEEDNT